MSIILRLFYLVLLLNGCSELNLNSNPVKLLDNGDYIYDFKYSDNCLSDDCIKVSAKKKLELLGLVPYQCKNGIDVYHANGPNNGWVYVKFRCK